ncbi:hypothetical protein BROUX41_000372 [Berkeleyomyces rouxiae]|uniref:uncharacterized protein n=1 Tax=Berkeleyomyces rouxiae TaxID=2035830 RepID=UPI003B81BB70
MKSTLFLLSTLALVSAQITEPASSTTSSAAAPVITDPPTLAPGEFYIMPYNEELLENIKNEDIQFLPDVTVLVGSRDGAQTTIVPAWLYFSSILMGLGMLYNIPPFTKLDPEAAAAMNVAPQLSEATSITTFTTVVRPTDEAKDKEE